MHASRRAAINAGCLSPAGAGEALGARTARGGLIGMAAQVLQVAIQLLSTALLARLLSPGDFGLVAMALTVTSFVGLFTDLGLSTPTIQRRTISQRAVSTLFFIGLAAGVVVALAASALAPLASMAFDDARVTAIVIGLAWAVPLGAATSQHGALLMRGMRWRAVYLVMPAAQAAGAAAAVGAALLTDLAYWALVIQVVVSAAVRLAATWTLCPWRPSLVLDWKAAREEIGFGLNLTGFGVVNYLHRQLDNVLIGWRWGEAELGFYSRAYALMMMPLALINGPVSTSMIPLLSRVQDDPELWRRYFLRAMAAICFAGYLVACVLIVNASDIVRIVLGPAWGETANIFMLLSISLFGAVPMNAMGWVYISLDRTRRMFRWSFISSGAIIASFLVGLPYGATGLALSYALGVCLMALPCFLFGLHGSPTSVRHLLRTIAAPLAVSALTLLTLQIALEPMLMAWDPLPRLVLGVTSTAAIFALLSWFAIVVDPWQSSQRDIARVLLQRLNPSNKDHSA